MNVGEKIDALYELRQERLNLEKHVDDAKLQEKTLESEIMLELNSLSATMLRGSKASFSVSKEVVPSVQSWGLLYDFIKGENDFTLLHKRISSTVWREYTDDGLLVPGTTAMELPKVSLRKL